MPAKKRADQTKRTPSTSPTTSTSHASVDQHHRLRHSGPSISTRSTSASSKPPAHPEPTSESAPTHPHDKKLLAEVSPPGARLPFTKFLYVLLFCVLLLFGWYLYGMITLLEQLKEEVGWWGIITGDMESPLRWGTTPGQSGFGSDRSGRQGGRTGADSELEGSLNALADVLGILPVQVASAVKPFVPQASLTSIASKSEETGASEAVRVLFEDTRQNDDDGDMADARRIAREFAERLGRSAAEENEPE